MKYKEFESAVEESYKKYFPYSMCQVQLYSGLEKMIFIDCYLAENKQEFINGIRHNDMFHINFSINVQDNFTADADMPEDMAIEVLGKSYSIKSENSNLAYENRKLSYRRTKGNSKKIITTLDKYFKVLQENVIADMIKKNIHSNYKALIVDKLLATSAQMDNFDSIKLKLTQNNS